MALLGSAALAVQELEQLRLAKDAAILVTGASGGVGSVSIALLKNWAIQI